MGNEKAEPIPTAILSTNGVQVTDEINLDKAGEAVVAVADEPAVADDRVPADAFDHFTHVRVPLTRMQFSLVYLGLILAILVACLDSTIVATALKAILMEFGRQDLVPWVGSSYLLTAAPFGVLYGKFADIFGRKWVIVVALSVFELGSLMCGIAKSMEFLIAGRAIAGIGGGGIFSLVVIVLADIVSIKDRGKYQGVIGAVFGLASVIGPLVGGVFTDNISWRWCFLINLPLGVVTLATIVAFLNFPSTEGSFSEKMKQVDLVGAFVLLCAIVALVTPLQLGGSIWAWNSAQTIGTLALSIVLFAVFVYVEVKIAKEPIIPAALFNHASVTPLVILTVCLGATFVSGSYFISLFFQVVFGQTATQAGLASVPMVFGLVLMSITTGVLVSKFGKYKIFFHVGPIILAAGTVLVAFMDSSTAFGLRLVYLFLFGLGAGTMIQMRTIAIQASVPQDLVAVATAVAGTAMTLGGGIGIAITGTIFNNVIARNTDSDAELHQVIELLASGNNSTVPDATETLQLLEILESYAKKHSNDSLTPVITAAMRELVSGFNSSFKTAYLCLLPFPIIIFLLAFWVKQVDFKMKGKERSETAQISAE